MAEMVRDGIDESVVNSEMVKDAMRFLVKDMGDLAARWEKGEFFEEGQMATGLAAALDELADEIDACANLLIPVANPEAEIADVVMMELIEENPDLQED